MIIKNQNFSVKMHNVIKGARFKMSRSLYTMLSMCVLPIASISITLVIPSHFNDGKPTKAH